MVKKLKNCLFGFFLFFTFSETVFGQNLQVGDAIDSLNGVKIYYNGTMRNVSGRNVVDGYNLGLKYQCVEFTKRYYFEYYNHRMPDSYGHAKSFFNNGVKDGQMNSQRGLIQYRNPSKSKPEIGDIIVMDEVEGNPFGHVAIISKVEGDSIEIVQQNKDHREPSRVSFLLVYHELDGWRINQLQTLGWLRKED